jgi:hypothetical protein
MSLTPTFGRARLSTVSIDEHITFEGSIEFFHRDGRIKCNASGEFLNDGKRFAPPLTYSLVSVGVAREDPVAVLRPIYYNLLSRDGYA